MISVTLNSVKYTITEGAMIDVGGPPQCPALTYYAPIAAWIYLEAQATLADYPRDDPSGQLAIRAGRYGWREL